MPKKKASPPDLRELAPSPPKEPAPLVKDPRFSESALAGVPTRRGIVAMVKALTGNGLDVLLFWNGVFRGDPTMGEFSGRERLEASKLLFERGFGKPVETTVLLDATAMEENVTLQSVSTDRLYELLEKVSPGNGAPVNVIEPGEYIPMPDVAGGLAYTNAVQSVKHREPAQQNIDTEVPAHLPEHIPARTVEEPHDIFGQPLRPGEKPPPDVAPAEPARGAVTEYMRDVVKADADRDALLDQELIPEAKPIPKTPDVRKRYNRVLVTTKRDKAQPRPAQVWTGPAGDPSSEPES